MLGQRVLTALALLAFLLPAIFLLDDRWWGILTALVIGVAAWEFARLARFCRSGQWSYGVLVAGSGLLFALSFNSKEVFVWVLALTPLSVLFWIGVAPFWLRFRWQIESHLLLALVGIVLLLPFWVSLVALRAASPWWLLAALAGVAFADIAAYFCGRRWGKRKLAPDISPGKTWEGAWGGMAAVTLFGFALLFLSGRPLTFVAIALILLVLPALAMLSIAGDLLESLLKRQAGLKDSSNLLPGHGGVLDRVDSHVSTLPLVALISQFL